MRRGGYGGDRRRGEEHIAVIKYEYCLTHNGVAFEHGNKQLKSGKSCDLEHQLASCGIAQYLQENLFIV